MKRVDGIPEPDMWPWFLRRIQLAHLISQRPLWSERVKWMRDTIHSLDRVMTVSCHVQGIALEGRLAESDLSLREETPLVYASGFGSWADVSPPSGVIKKLLIFFACKTLLTFAYSGDEGMHSHAPLLSPASRHSSICLLPGQEVLSLQPLTPQTEFWINS